MNNILLLGGTGFLGKPLLQKLETKNSVKIMIHNSNLQTSAKKFKGDILIQKSFSKEIRNNETVINLLGQMSADENGFINSNIIGGLNLLNSCIKKKIKRVILISSINVYGENLERPSKETDRLCPKTTYAGVKMITEQMYKAFAENHGINITILRVAGIFGPGNKRGFLTKIIQSIKNKNITPVCYNNGEQQRDILYIDDVVDCILNVVNSQHDGFHVFNISSGKRHSINELISMIEKISKTKISAKYSSEIPDEKCIWADNTKAKKFLKFNPKVGIEAGLEYAVNQFLN
tara:strand:+ start:9895 stop:10767 length:873 start_codon:yes stop_codon:yes gene_type:complete